MPVYKAEAIVLRRVNLGEADRLVTLFARDQGKLTAVAKGARKPKSRFAGRLELFTHLRVLLGVGRNLDVVSQVEVLNAFVPLREDLRRMGYASYAVELTDRATADREPAPEMFRSLRSALALMRQGDPEVAAMWFAARLLVLTGYSPLVGRCQVCGRPLKGAAAFSFALGGTLCESDRTRDIAAVPASAAVLQAMGFLLQADATVLPRLALDARQRAELGTLFQRYFEYRLETKLRSPTVIRRLAERGSEQSPQSPRSE